MFAQLSLQKSSTVTIEDRQQDLTYSMYRTQKPVWLHKLQKRSSQAQSRVALLLPNSTGEHHEEATAYVPRPTFTAPCCSC
jgi:hypothetical protein